MSNLAWLAISWILVAALCYFIVFKLGRQAPSDEQLETKHGLKPVISRPVNETEGASTLINNVIKWIHENTNKQFRPFHLQLINALEEAAKKNLHDEPYDLKFNKNIEPGQIDPPEFSSFKFVTGKTNQIAAKAHAFVKNATLKLQISKRRNDQFVVNNYEALLSKIETDIDMRVVLITNRIHLIICPTTTPTSQIILYGNDNSRVTDPESLELHNIINKVIGTAILDFELDSLVDSEKNQRDEGSTINVIKKLYQSNDNVENSRPVSTANRLVVNVVRAYDLKIKEVDQQPFVVIEMDEPQRKHVTPASQGKNPMWNETFDFDLSNGSDEILFEIYNPTTDENKENSFVGLAIVGINELIKTRNPIQYLKLQGRPYHDDDVGGTLLIQFDFSSDSKASLVGSHKQQIRLVNSNGEQLSETTVHTIKPLGSGMGSLKNVDNLEPIPTKTTTITVKGIQMNENPKSIQNSYDIYDPYDSQFHLKDDIIKRQQSEEKSQASIVHKAVHATQSADQNHHEFYDFNQGYSSDNQRDMSPRIAINRRSGSEKRKRERSFFEDLRNRLSKKRKQYGRSKSADPASHSLVEAESIPPSRDQSQVREYDDHAKFTGDENSKCTLVLELQHSGENKYFLIPPSIAREPAAANILKKGKKLHLCKNHTFVAVKSTSGIVCNACGTKVATGFNKQAYQCRACRMICHKACHTYVQSDCHVDNPMKLSLAKDVDWAHYLSHSRLTEYISAENL